MPATKVSPAGARQACHGKHGLGSQVSEDNHGSKPLCIGSCLMPPLAGHMLLDACSGVELGLLAVHHCQALLVTHLRH